MTFKLYEDTWETSTTTGTGAYTLAGAVSGWRTFSAQYANTDTCYYAAYDGSNFELGVGTFSSGANTIARTTIYRSSNGGAAVNWAAGTRNIVVAPLGIVLESLLTPGNTGIPNRTADNTWAYLPYANGSWTPADASGAGLTFSAVSCNYTRIGNMVFAYGAFAYPVTANGSNTLISGLPFAVASAQYARQGFMTVNTSATVFYPVPVDASSTFRINKASGNIATNTDVSNTTFYFHLIYPVA